MSEFTKQQKKQMLKQYIRHVKPYGRDNVKQIKRIFDIAMQVEALESKFENYTNEQLKDMTAQFKQRYKDGETLNQLLPEAFAVCREAAKRTLNQRHYFVQLMGGVILHEGKVCEMATGEGKTLTSTLPAYLNSLTGEGVHIVTVNDYLATRDSVWMGKLYRFLGVTVGLVVSDDQKKSSANANKSKKEAYACDITYTTNSEAGFDYLRDNLAMSKEEVCQRSLAFAIVDEVDSILIDEARTPLIISGKEDVNGRLYYDATRFVSKLTESTNVDSEGKVEGQQRYDRFAISKRNDEDSQPNGDFVVDYKHRTVVLTDSGVDKAEKFFHLDNLGDINNVELNNVITNALKARTLFERDVDYLIENREIILIDTNTGRKMYGRRYSDGLHSALEAKEHLTVQPNSSILATISYQNFFRLYKKLSGMTGTAKTEEDEFNVIYKLDVVVLPTNKPVVRIDHPDQVFATRQDKLQYIVDKIAELNAVGRPVLVGTVSVQRSEELSEMLKKRGIKHNVLNAKFPQAEASVVAQAGRLNTVTIATNMAGRGTDILLGGNPEFIAKQMMEKKGFSPEQIEIASQYLPPKEDEIPLRNEYAKYLKESTAVTEQEKAKVLELGGLYVIGTEKHESRRIDNQLRGRAGRQGDPGESEFTEAMDDELMRVFGSMQSKLSSLMSSYKLPEVIAKVQRKAILKAQKNIESRNYGSRKHVLQYDDVNNTHRKTLYRTRNEVLFATDEQMHPMVKNMVKDFVRNTLAQLSGGNEAMESLDIEKVNQTLNRLYFGTEEHQPLEFLTEGQYDNMRQFYADLVNKFEQRIDEVVKPDEKGERLTKYLIFERATTLRYLTVLWKRHINNLDALRDGISMQAYAQRDPVIEYRRQSTELFDEMMDTVSTNVVSAVLSVNMDDVVLHERIEQRVDENKERALNRPCPCGSGKKYKHCCYQKDLERKKLLDISNVGKTVEEQQPQPLTKQEEYALKRQQRKEQKQQQQNKN